MIVTRMTIASINSFATNISTKFHMLIYINFTHIDQKRKLKKKSKKLTEEKHNL